MKLISLLLGNALVHHGYAPDNQEIVTQLTGQPFQEKLVAVDRILSISEKYVLVQAAFGRVMYFEYDEDFKALHARLRAAQLLAGAEHSTCPQAC